MQAELTLTGLETKFEELKAQFNGFENKEEIKKEFVTLFSQHAFKNLKDGLEHLESVKRAEKRLAELPALIEAKKKEIEELSFTNNPEFHKKETREKVKGLDKELEGLETEFNTFPNDIKHRLMQADLNFKNFIFNAEQMDLVKKFN